MAFAFLNHYFDLALRLSHKFRAIAFYCYDSYWRGGGIPLLVIGIIGFVNTCSGSNSGSVTAIQDTKHSIPEGAKDTNEKERLKKPNEEKRAREERTGQKKEDAPSIQFAWNQLDLQTKNDLVSAVRLFDYYENSGESLTHYIKMFKVKPYIVERYFVPHDANSHEFGSGLTRTQIARNHGIDFTTVSKLSIEEGIDAVRNLLNRCWFDGVKCEKGLHSLENYRKEWDDSHGCWKNRPRHDFASNGADAFRYLAVSLQKARTQADDEADYQAAMRTFHEPRYPLFGDFCPPGYF